MKSLLVFKSFLETLNMGLWSYNTYLHHLWNINCLAGSVPSTSNTLSYLNLAAGLRGRNHYYSHFADEQRGLQG